MGCEREVKAKCHEHANVSWMPRGKYKIPPICEKMFAACAILKNILAIILSCLHERKERGEREGGGVGEGG
jgi:hypothetical protein